MLKFLKKEANMTLTENRATTYATSSSDCLDLFATIGALRRETETEINARFDRAWAENADIAMKTLFFARDIRGGLGERHVFRTILRNMAYNRADTIAKNLWAVPEFGRFDDLLALLDTPAKYIALEYISSQFNEDMAALKNDGDVSLLGKWLPSVNAHNANTIRYGKMISKALGLAEAEYRKSLTALRAKIAIIENNIREQDYTFDYAKQPSKAMFKYRKAFMRNDGERYKEYLSSVERGEAKMNVGALLPYEIIRSAFNGGYSVGNITADERRSMDVTWKAQNDFTRGENSLVVVDGSGSMYGGADPKPAAVALSLGIYFAERNSGAFQNHFITFSENPRLVEIKGKDIYDKVKYAASFNEVANTNIQKVFELILRTAVKNKLPQNELPSTLFIISDMEFDACVGGADITNFEYAKKEFARNGYTLPTVVFWNVASRNQQQPVTMNERGVVLVSGASPRVFSMISSGNLSPYAFMLDTLDAERYAKIIA
ncbi:MAG: DUF2828 domain-containing protein [Oscillospiraceae bacterium]|nr:DUF2828 domain-containing protein [Oscillospiraceae bacterium]